MKINIHSIQIGASREAQWFKQRLLNHWYKFLTLNLKKMQIAST